MIISVNNVHSQVLEYTQEEFILFREALTFWNKNAVFSKAFRNKVWDGYVRFFKNGRYFPTGLLHLVEEKVPEVIYRKARYPKPPVVNPNILKNKSMTARYAYQFETVQTMLEERRGIIYQATNAGKSTISAAFIETLRVPTLFLVHQKELMKQIYDTFTEQTTLEIGRWGSGMDDRKFITIGMVPTIARRLKNKADREWLSKIECVIVDEVHMASSKSFVKVLEACTGASYRIGLSGTPLDKASNIDNITIQSMTGKVIAEVRNQELVNLNVSSKPIITMYNIEHSEYNLPYPEVYLQGIINNEYRNGIIVSATKELLTKKHTVLILVKRVQHGKNLKEMFANEGIDTAFCYGESSDVERENEICSIREGRSKILILSKIGQVGLDIPNLSAGIRCGSGKSVIETLQGLGRYLRNPTDGENEVIMIDFMDKDGNYLEKHSIERKKAYEREKFSVTIKDYKRLDNSL